MSYFCLSAKFREKIEFPKYGTKNVLFEYFKAKILKNYCDIWNQFPRVYLIAKSWEKTKVPKFRTKNVLFEYF